MDYVTTNIRIAEDDYLKLKAEAAKKRKSLAALIREKIGSKGQKPSQAKVERFLMELDEVASENSKYLKGWNSAKSLREMRHRSKW